MLVMGIMIMITGIITNGDVDQGYHQGQGIVGFWLTPRPSPDWAVEGILILDRGGVPVMIEETVWQRLHLPKKDFDPVLFSDFQSFCLCRKLGNR